jgi:hypothetical protein
MPPKFTIKILKNLNMSLLILYLQFHKTRITRKRKEIKIYINENEKRMK